jgi:hypothetical protein
MTASRTAGEPATNPFPNAPTRASRESPPAARVLPQARSPRVRRAARAGARPRSPPALPFARSRPSRSEAASATCARLLPHGPSKKCSSPVLEHCPRRPPMRSTHHPELRCCASGLITSGFSPCIGARVRRLCVWASRCFHHAATPVLDRRSREVSVLCYERCRSLRSNVHSSRRLGIPSSDPPMGIFSRGMSEGGGSGGGLVFMLFIVGMLRSATAVRDRQNGTG